MSPINLGDFIYFKYMRKIFRKIHLWLSIPVGLIITIICFTGAILVFETEITEALHKNRYYVEEVKEETIPMNKLLRDVSKQLPDSVSITGINISSDSGRAYQLMLSKPRRASVYVDQYTGEIKYYNQRSPFFLTVFRLHRWLLDSQPAEGGIFWGKIIVGTCTLIFIFILITGIVIWFPKSSFGLKNRLRIKFDKGWRRFFYDLHVAGGFYATILLLLMALTGPTWSFPWYRTGFYKVFGIEMTQMAPHPGAPQTTQGNNQGNPNQNNNSEGRRTANANSEQRGERKENIAEGNQNRERGQNEERAQNRERALSGERSASQERGSKPQGGERGSRAVNFYRWQSVYDQLAAQNKGFKQISISNDAANVSFSRFGNQRAADKYTFNAQTGEITNTELYKDMGKESKIRGWIYTVHVGSWGGVITKILTVLAALIGATLPATGYYFWIKRTFFKKRKSTV